MLTWLLITEAPQKKLPPLVKATCHGQEFWIAKDPPTIFKPVSSGLIAWTPQPLLKA